jgi:hypothetical protein
MNGYVAIYKGKRIEVYAETAYKAQQAAARVLGVKPKQERQISILLCERADGSEVTHMADF